MSRTKENEDASSDEAQRNEEFWGDVGFMCMFVDTYKDLIGGSAAEAKRENCAAVQLIEELHKQLHRGLDDSSHVFEPSRMRGIVRRVESRPEMGEAGELWLESSSVCCAAVGAAAIAAETHEHKSEEDLCQLFEELRSA